MNHSDSRLVQSATISAIFGPTSTPSGGWDMDHRTVSAADHPQSSPVLNTELTLPSFRTSTSYPSTTQHHVHLNDSQSSHSPNPFNHNGFNYSTSPLIRQQPPNPHSRTISVLDPIFRHEPTQHHISQSPFTNLQYLSHPLLDTFGNAQSPTLSPLDFTQLRSDYLSMTAATNPTPNKAEGHKAPASSPSLSPLTPLLDDEMAVQAVMDVLEASPEFKMENEFTPYLTSPLDDSPLGDDPLTTPSFGSAGDLRMDILTSPALIDSTDNFVDLPLFSDVPLFDLTFDKLNAHNAAQPLFPPESKMYTMGSPHSSSHDSVSLRSNPQSVVARDVSATSGGTSRGASKARSVSAPTKTNRRKSAPTGTRKNVTPESLVPIEAPIQPRKYVTSSATSRKELPAVFARKRKRSMALGAEVVEDEKVVLDPSVVPPSPFETDAIEAKRRQNTLAARRSRKRKLEHQQELENAIDAERREKEAWKARAIALETLLRGHGIKIPSELDESRC